MDSNGTRFVLIKGPSAFRSARRDCGWNASLEAFTLARQDQPRIPRLDPARALELWRDAIPYVLDDYGQIGRLSADHRSFEWSLNWPGKDWLPVRAAIDPDISIAKDAAADTLDPVDAPKNTTFTDLHLGGSGLVALPYSDGDKQHGLLLTHLRRRWQAHCTLPFAPKRAWVDAEDRVWVAGETQLGLCRGAPLPQPYYPHDDRFEPVETNPDPLRLLWQQNLPKHNGLMALAADDDTLVLLVRDEATPERQQLLVRPLSASSSAPFTTYLIPAELPLATDISCIAPNQVLLLPPFQEGASRGQERDCPALELTISRTGTPMAQLLPERWPRNTEAGVRFVRHRDNGVRTLTAEGVVPLYRLAQARFPHTATAVLTLPLDSGTPGTIWHRLYLEACIPPGCQIEITAKAFEVWRGRPRPGSLEKQPDPTWLPIASEIPFATPTLTPVPEREGLFEVLLQRPNGAVRDLAGRYLQLGLTLSGDGRHTPAISAIRAWYPRFSWQAHYLPNHFHQQETQSATITSEAANSADLRERLLACFEGMMTPIEDRIAAAETLLYPDATPAPFLPWLAQMTATRLPRHWPEPRQRRWLTEQGHLQRQRGTFGGLCQALDIITDGGVSRGEVVPVELFRLRRTLATILGISMDDTRHPLTLGTGQSGNSLVGGSLILADDNAREFLALFAPELSKDKLERETVERFFDHYARRLTVVLHGPARQQRQVVAEALPGLVPAVVQWQLLESDHPFVLGLSPLLRIDTFLEQEPAPGRVQLNRTRLGRGHLLQNPVALSPEHAIPVKNNQKGDRP